MVAILGATPIFVDVFKTTYNLDPNSLSKNLEIAKKGLNPKGIIAVDLFGQPADYINLERIAHKINYGYLLMLHKAMGVNC